MIAKELGTMHPLATQLGKSRAEDLDHGATRGWPTDRVDRRDSELLVIVVVKLHAMRGVVVVVESHLDRGHHRLGDDVVGRIERECRPVVLICIGPPGPARATRFERPANALRKARGRNALRQAECKRRKVRATASGRRTVRGGEKASATAGQPTLMLQ